jgi:hypothetical protein
MGIRNLKSFLIGSNSLEIEISPNIRDRLTPVDRGNIDWGPGIKASLQVTRLRESSLAGLSPRPLVRPALAVV